MKMGTLIPAGRDAPLKLAEALQNGQHVAMLVDQYLTNGVEVTFFGRKTKANPMLARLLRQVECPIHGVRIIRLPGHRFRAELSEEVKPVRDAAGTDRHPGHDAGDHLGGRGLDPRISGPVAVAAPPLAVKLSRHRRVIARRCEAIQPELKQPGTGLLRVMRAMTDDRTSPTAPSSPWSRAG